MARIKNTPSKKVKGAAASAGMLGAKKSLLLKKIANVTAAAAGAMAGQKAGKKGLVGGILHQTKLKVPFKPASSQLAGGKKGLLKQLKRRWRSGTVAKREIRKLSRTTDLQFPKLSFQRLVREIAQEYEEIRFTKDSMLAIQEAAEDYVIEMCKKADMARRHAKRETIDERDMLFARFMKPDCLWVPTERIWERETFSYKASASATTQVANATSSKKQQQQQPLATKSADGEQQQKEDESSKKKAQESETKKRKKDGDEDEKKGEKQEESKASKKQMMKSKSGRPEEGVAAKSIEAEGVAAAAAAADADIKQSSKKKGGNSTNMKKHEEDDKKEKKSIAAEAEDDDNDDGDGESPSSEEESDGEEQEEQDDDEEEDEEVEEERGKGTKADN